LTLKLRVGKKGYVIIPKAIREAVGVEEGDDLIVSLNDGIKLTPVRKFDRGAFEKAVKAHKKEVFSLKNADAPEPGEASKYSLEDEFD
jgi:AbrB family looped-hinge helix DNA binding protein